MENACQKYCRMLRGEHAALLSTFIRLPLVIKVFVLSIFEWPFYTGFTVRLFTVILYLWYTKENGEVYGEALLVSIMLINQFLGYI